MRTPLHGGKHADAQPLNVSEQTVTEIAKDLCAFFHQESVMVTFSPVKVVFIQEQL